MFAVLSDGERVSAPPDTGAIFEVALGGEESTDRSERYVTHVEAGVRHAFTRHRERVPADVRWQDLLKALERRGVKVSGVELDALPLEVELSDRLRQALGA
jgi:hypothetical protein